MFDETQFHRENNIAHELEQVINTFFTGPTRRDTLERIRPFFDVINAQASGIASHKEKQKFLKVVYENFYRAYNPKGADRLGIVYTPNEVVRFMIESTDFLTEKHFNKLLGDKGVEILDPATGTGTFLTELLEYLPKQTLAHKYQHELYANEVAILPYYIANLNIEYTYKQKMGEYAEFHNICFVDTLDNVGFQKTRRGQLGPQLRAGPGKRAAHPAPEPARNLGHHRQPALQRQPAERERQQQEPHVPRRGPAHQGHVPGPQHGPKNEAVRYVRPLFPLGLRPAGRQGRAGLHHQQQLHSLAHLRRLPQGRGRRVFGHLPRGPGRRRARQPQALGHQAQRVRHSDGGGDGLFH
ncbi:MAG: N-6 DNA methylase [Hymenobacter sp.]